MMQTLDHPRPSERIEGYMKKDLIKPTDGRKAKCTRVPITNLYRGGIRDNIALTPGKIRPHPIPKKT